MGEIAVLPYNLGEDLIFPMCKADTSALRKGLWASLLEAKVHQQETNSGMNLKRVNKKNYAGLKKFICIA